MNSTKTKTQMDFYYELTQSSILFFQTKDPKKIIYSCGLSTEYLINYYELQEPIDYVANSPDLTFNFTLNNPYFLTFYTKHNFIYNIFFLESYDHGYYCFVSGPNILGFPTLEQVNLFSKDIQLELTLRQQLLRDLYHIPKSSENKIQSSGKLFYMIFHPTLLLPNEINQIIISKQRIYPFHMPKKATGNEVHSYETTLLFDFLMKLQKELINEKYDDLHVLLQDNIHSLDHLIHKFDNLYSLKSFCLITCTSVYLNALHSNISFELLFYKLWNFVIHMGPLHTAEEIIQLMEVTLNDFSKSIYMQDSNYSPHVNQILKYIRLHYSQKITLEVLANNFHISMVYISHIIKKDTNLSLSEHINMERIRHGKLMLANTSQSISEISYSLGYNYQSHFTKIFKKYTGITPKQFRETSSK